MTAIQSQTNDPIGIIRTHGGMIRTSQAKNSGIHTSTLYDLRKRGVIERLGRGLYRLTELPPLSNPDLVAIALRAPKSVVSLLSALAFHELTTQVPHEIHIALARGCEAPRIEQPPVHAYWFTGAAFTEGIEIHQVDGVPVKIYSIEKTLADTFKYRNKLGMETVLEALRFYRDRKQVDIDKLLHFAKVCRVERLMRPYLEAIL